MKKKLIVAGVILAVLYFFGFRITHPDDGLNSWMGSAKSSLAIYQGADEYQLGQKVVFDYTYDDGRTVTYTGVVLSVNGDRIGVDSNDTQRNASIFRGELKADEIRGKLFVVVPFFGTILGIVGL